MTKSNFRKIDYDNEDYPFAFSEDVETMREYLVDLKLKKAELTAFVDNVSLKHQWTDNALKLFDLDSHYLFVYDWHRKGMPNHGQLKEADFLGETVTCDPDWQMMIKPSKSMQAITPSNSSERGNRVMGEVYRVTPETILNMDRYQIGYNKLTRKRIDIKINPFLQDNKNATNCLKCHTYMLLDTDAKKQYTKFNRTVAVKSVGIVVYNSKTL